MFKEDMEVLETKHSFGRRQLSSAGNSQNEKRFQIVLEAGDLDRPRQV